MKIKIVLTLFFISTGITATEESWDALFEQTKLPEDMYQEISGHLAHQMLAHKDNHDLFLASKMWLMKQKDYRAQFNKGALDIATQIMRFRFYTAPSLPFPYKENAGAPLFKNYSEIIALLLRMRFEKITGLRKKSTCLSNKNDYSFAKKFLQRHEESIPFISKEEFKKKFQEIPDIIELAVYIDESSSLAQAILQAMHSKTNPLVTLHFASYQLPTIRQSFPLSLNSSEIEQSFASSTSSQISSCSFIDRQTGTTLIVNSRLPQVFPDETLSTYDYRKISKSSTTPSDYSSDSITTISSSTESDSSSESMESSDLVFTLDN